MRPVLLQSLLAFVALGTVLVSYSPSTDAASVGVVAGAATGEINGRVTDEATGEPLAGICVGVTEPGLSGDPRFAETDGDGFYRVMGLAPGEYQVGFQDCSEQRRRVDEWYDDHPGLLTAVYRANRVAVTAGGKTSYIDAELATGGTISGTITQAGTDVPVPAVVVVHRPGEHGLIDDVYAFEHAGTDGRYTTLALPAGEYTVEFVDSFLGSTIEWFDDRRDRQLADAVSVTAGEDTAGIDASVNFYGDANCDGTTDELDALAIFQDVAGLTSVECWTRAHVNNDIVVDVRDAALILQFVAGLIPHPYPARLLIDGRAPGSPPAADRR